MLCSQSSGSVGRKIVTDGLKEYSPNNSALPDGRADSPGHGALGRGPRSGRCGELFQQTPALQLPTSTEFTPGFFARSVSIRAICSVAKDISQSSGSSARGPEKECRSGRLKQQMLLLPLEHLRRD
jgi:hypothetical protein